MSTQSRLLFSVLRISLIIFYVLALRRWSVDLSADGSVLALGTGAESHEAASGNAAIQVFKWNGTYYSPFLNQLPSGETSAVSLSRDGKALAVGRPYYGKNGGITTVYKFQQPGCDGDGNSKLLRISYTTDGKPHESRFTLQVGPDITIQGSPNLQFTTFVEELCVAANECVKFRVYDSVGDGMDAPGGYSLMLDGIEVAYGGDFGFGEIKHVGDCSCPAGQSMLSILAVDNDYSEYSMEWALSFQNKTSLGEYFWRSTMSNNVERFEECIPNGCWHLTTPQCFIDKACVATREWSSSHIMDGRRIIRKARGFAPRTLRLVNARMARLPQWNILGYSQRMPPLRRVQRHRII